jgi:hypothetical protein
LILIIFKIIKTHNNLKNVSFKIHEQSKENDLSSTDLELFKEQLKIFDRFGNKIWKVNFKTDKAIE